MGEEVGRNWEENEGGQIMIRIYCMKKVYFSLKMIDFILFRRRSFF